MRARKKQELKVFKLRSGEEIIAKVAGKTKDKIRLHRPMRILNNVQTDPYSGTKRHVIFFSDWLGSTSDITADIPLDFVVVELPPDPDMISLYDRQTEFDDRGGVPPQPKQTESPFGEMSEEEAQKLSDKVDQELERMLKQLAEGGLTGGEKPPFPPSGFLPVIPDFPPPRASDGILFSVSIPNEVMQSWVESGFIDYLMDSVQDFVNTEFMENLMNDDGDEVPNKPKKAKKKNKREKISKDEWTEPTDDLKKKPNYGNNHEDWSPYLKDYLDKPEPPKNEQEG